MATQSLRPTAVTGLLATITLAPIALAADPVKIGPEIIVSTDNAEHVPRIAADSIGNFMIIWEDQASVQARRFYANGNEHLAQFELSDPNHTLGTDGSSSTGNIGIAGDAVGNFVVTYGAENDSGDPKCAAQPCVWTRRNDANGLTAPSIFVLQDPSQTYVYDYFERDQVSNPEIASLGSGDFVVAWEGYDKYDYLDGTGFGSDESTFAIKTVPVGQQKGQYFRVNTYDYAYQGQYGNLAADGGPTDGSFVVAFKSEYTEYYETGLPFPGGNIRARLYDKNNKAVGDEFGTSDDDATNGFAPDIAQAPDGTFMVIWNRNGVHGRVFDGSGAPVTGDFQIGTGSQGYPAVAASDGAFIVLWTDGQVKGKRFDLAGNEISSEFQVNTVPNGRDVDVAAAANGDFVATWMQSRSPRAQRFRLAPPAPVAMPVLGKALVLTNKIPDNPEKNKGKWKAGGENIVAPARGSASDPRCIGDPDGTVKAVLRFWSDDSGHDTGLIPLPCQHWSATGSNTVKTFGKRGYKYSDSKLTAGPCSAVKIKGTKSLSISCKGKPGIATFPYDLEVGTSEVEVNAMLELGNHRYCSTLPAIGFDGSDGKKFRGKNLPGGSLAPCPTGALGLCGNGAIGLDEVCDDGNALDGDYCSANCTEITSVCGDGNAELAEACDDGNAADGDYCSADCSKVTSVCGDGAVELEELCDDGNVLDGDYCNATCTTVTAVCGDSATGPGEACDDGNTAPGDYCSSDCSTVTAVCGDGIIGSGEACDDGNTTGGDYCSADCSQQTAVCGDSMVGPGEACDDGNTVGGDLCAADCLQELSICGDGIISGEECCDDGNTVSGDGCSATCDSGSSCPLASPPIDAHYRGYYRSPGTHYPNNNSTITGRTSVAEYNSYFAFDTSGVTGTVVRATLRLEVVGFAGSSPRTAYVWDVSPSSTTVQFTTFSTHVYDSLGSGLTYGSFQVASSDVGSEIDIELNGTALNRININLGFDFVVGLSQPVASDNHWVSFSTGSEPGTHRLILYVLP